MKCTKIRCRLTGVMTLEIYINAKQLSKRKPRVAACRYSLARQPENLRDLIRMMVVSGVDAYNSRIQNPNTAQPVSAEALESMSQIGRIGFGIPYGSREADPEEAVATAIQGFEDGLYRFFIGDREVEELDAPLALSEGDTITIIRLTMLTGGYF